MKKSLGNTKTKKQDKRAEERDAKKFQYLSSIKAATLEKVGKITVVKIVEGDDRQCEIRYQDGTSNMEIYAISINGRRTKLSPRVTGVRHSINRNNTLICVNELIHQASRLANGLSVELGDYNHHLPCAFLKKLNKKEVFSVWTGDICTKDQNKAHWLLCNRVYKETGLMCSFKSYTQAYKLLGLKNITEKDVKKYKHINRGSYLEILD